MKFTDAVAVAGTRRTNDGYLIADAKAVRTGIQLYAGYEVGKPEKDVVRVYRSEDEVRSADSLRSFSHAPITIDHPAEAVTADNWKDLAVGEISTAASWDGSRISLPLILKDKAAIDAVFGGKRELSAGYTCDLDWTPGKTPDGQAYDAAQTNIRANHVAIVDRGRAGPECRIGDAGQHEWGAAPIRPTTDTETHTMSDALRTVVVDGLSVSTTDQGAQAITKLLKDLDSSAAKFVDLQMSHADAIKVKDADLAKKDEEIGTLKADKKKLEDAALKPADIDRLVADRAVLVSTVRAIDANLEIDGKPDAELRRAAVKARLGDELVKDASDAEIAGMFKAIAKDVKPVDPVTAALRTGPLATNDANASAKAYDQMVSGMTAAWQNSSNGKAA